MLLAVPLCRAQLGTLHTVTCIMALLSLCSYPEFVFRSSKYAVKPVSVHKCSRNEIGKPKVMV